jgi:diguanylate cyclase (GGDEF)-like protein/PAS domain S-box-containing protein
LDQWIPAFRNFLSVTWPFLAIVAILFWLCLESVDVLASLRTFSEGNANWSKEQKAASYELLVYSYSGAPSNFRNYEDAIKLPLALKKFREEVLQPELDSDSVHKALLEARVHQKDMDQGIRFLRRFQAVPLVAETFRIWRESDELLQQIAVMAPVLRDEFAKPVPDRVKLTLMRRQVEIVNAQLAEKSKSFTMVLGDAARFTQRVLLLAIVATAALLLPIGFWLTNRTLERKRKVEVALQESEERLNLAVTGTLDGLWDWKLSTDELYCSPRFGQLLGYDNGLAIATMQGVSELVHDADRFAARQALANHLKRHLPFDCELRIQMRSGEFRWFRARGRAVRDPQTGWALRMAGALTDISNEKTAVIDLFAEKERAQVTLKSIADAVIRTDLHGIVEYLNPAACAVVGWKQDRDLAIPWTALARMVDEATNQVVADPVAAAMQEGHTIESHSHKVLIRHDGSEIAVTYMATPVRQHDGTIVGAVLVLRDVSTERQFAAKLTYQASHDALTGLINRTEFDRRLEVALQSAAKLGRNHAIMYLDLDQFKVVNDTCGHAAGDRLMRQVSGLLRSEMRESDTLARLGGDEFGVLLENCTQEAALRIAEQLRSLVEDFHFAFGEMRFHIGASIGLVHVSDGTLTLAEVLRAADAACYLAKEKGRNRVQVYRPDDRDLTTRQGEMRWAGRLQQALDDDRFVLYAQEIFPVSGPREHGIHCELLVRMVDDNGKIVPPMAFIPAAERYNLMPQVDRWVVRNALATLKRLRIERAEPAIGLCSINLSAATIGDERFPGFLRDQIELFDVPPELLCFEVTETAAIANLDRALDFMNEFSAQGVRFSLDDFGSGMSSFGYLKHLPVDFLKIDGAFIKDLATDPVDRAMVEAINSVGHAMGKLTIAEFVGDERVLKILNELDVDYAQGFFLGRPRPLARRLALAQRSSG